MSFCVNPKFPRYNAKAGDSAREFFEVVSNGVPIATFWEQSDAIRFASSFAQGKPEVRNNSTALFTDLIEEIDFTISKIISMKNKYRAILAPLFELGAVSPDANETIQRYFLESLEIIRSKARGIVSRQCNPVKASANKHCIEAAGNSLKINVCGKEIFVTRRFALPVATDL